MLFRSEKAKKRAIAAEYSAAVNQSLIDTQALQILGLEEEIRREKLKHDKKVAEFIQKQNMSEAKITDLESRGLANAEQIAAIEKKREEERERLEALEKERKDLEQKVNAGRDLKRAIRAIGKNYTKERDRANKAEAALKRGFDKEKTCEMATANWENTKNTPDEKEIFWSVLENLGCVTKGQDTEVSNEKTRNVSMVAPPRGSVAMKKKLSKEEITRIRKEWEMAEQKEAGDRLKQSQEASREEVQNRYDEMERMIPGSKAQRMRGVPKTSTKQRRKAKKVKKPTRTQLGYLIKQLQRRLQRNSSAIKNLPEDAFRGSRKSGFSKVETRGVEQPKIAEKKKLSMKEALDALESKRNTVYKNLTKDEFYSQIYIPTFDRIQTQLKAEERNKLKKISK